MSLNDTVSAERIHIGFFGMRNAGKSSLVNAVTGQHLSLVSDVPGTTTDPVNKAMELLPLGPVVIIDTAGIDDTGELGKMRSERARQILSRTDIAVLVVDTVFGIRDYDRSMVLEFRKRNIPYIIAFNKSDIADVAESEAADLCPQPEAAVNVSALTGEGVNELKEALGALGDKVKNDRELISDLISPGETVILVTPIDESAPKGRLILPQQQTIRSLLDIHASAIVVQETELPHVLDSLSVRPAMVITDSQVFKEVNRVVPEDILLTSFSILFARYKGELYEFVRGAAALDTLNAGDTILMAEGCTHHRQCNDIGTVKLPGWIRNYTGKDFNYEYVSGTEFPEDLSGVSLIIHCGACMLNEREVRSRTLRAIDAGIKITNYGMVIAQTNGILTRALSPFPYIYDSPNCHENT